VTSSVHEFRGRRPQTGSPGEACSPQIVKPKIGSTDGPACNVPRPIEGAR
jgi:hypothetical protein